MRFQDAARDAPYAHVIDDLYVEMLSVEEVAVGEFAGDLVAA